jgi:endonuclease YncB( thermonuclease family)
LATRLGANEGNTATGATTAPTAPTATAPTASAPGSAARFSPGRGQTAPLVFGSAPFGPTETARVVRIVDGDTIVVDRGHGSEKLRYIGMDTPETVDPNSPVEWMGPQASKANAALVAGKTVRLERDVSDVDRYGRLLRDVWLPDSSRPSGWLFVNLELIERGYAQVATFPPDVRYVDVLLAAQARARDADLGLWGPEPAATARSSPVGLAGATACSPSYTSCLPIVDDLNCPAVRAMGKAPVKVIGPDMYRLDSDGDGVACE